MIVRLLLGAGLFAFGYYIGKQVGRTEPIREELARAREQEPTENGNKTSPDVA